MKKSFITYAVTFLPLTCYANFSHQEEMSIILKILIALCIVVILASILVIVANKISNKREKEKESKNRKKDSNYKKKISENLDLKSEKNDLNTKLAGKDEEINNLKNQLTEKDNEIASLKRQIIELNSSFSSSSMHSNDSNKQDENINKTDVDDNNKTNSSPLVGKLNYIELAVINGSLVKAESEQTYYRAWRENGQIMFEFVNNDRTRKAINNRTIIVEPFCIKLESSKSPDVSEEIETKTPGILNDDFTLRKKAEIIYK